MIFSIIPRTEANEKREVSYIMRAHRFIELRTKKIKRRKKIFVYVE